MRCSRCGREMTPGEAIYVYYSGRDIAHCRKCDDEIKKICLTS